MSAWKRFAHGKAIPESDVEAERIRDPISATLLTAAIAFRLGDLDVAKAMILKVPFPIVRDKMRARYAALIKGIRAVLRSKNGRPLGEARDVVPLRVNETRRRERELAMAIRRFPVVPPWLISLRKLRAERALPIIKNAVTVPAIAVANKQPTQLTSTSSSKSIMTRIITAAQSIPRTMTHFLTPEFKYIDEAGLRKLIGIIFKFPVITQFDIKNLLSDKNNGFKVPVSFQNIKFHAYKSLDFNDRDKYVDSWAPQNSRTTDLATIKFDRTLLSTTVADYGFIYKNFKNDWHDKPNDTVIDYKCQSPIYMFLKELNDVTKFPNTTCINADEVLRYIRDTCKLEPLITQLTYKNDKQLVPDQYKSHNSESVAALFKSIIDIVNKNLLKECERTTFKSDLFGITITRGYGEKKGTVVKTYTNAKVKHAIEEILQQLK